MFLVKRNKEICSPLFLEGSVLHAFFFLCFFFFFPNPATDLFHVAVTCVQSLPPRVSRRTRGPGTAVAALLRAPTCTLPGPLEDRALGCPLAPWWSLWPFRNTRLHLISKTSSQAPGSSDTHTAIKATGVCRLGTGQATSRGAVMCSGRSRCGAAQVTGAFQRHRGARGQGSELTIWSCPYMSKDDSLFTFLLRRPFPSELSPEGPLGSGHRCPRREARTWPCGHCNPQLGCPETRPAPLSRGEGLRAAGEEAHPNLHPHLSGVSQVEAHRSRPGPLRTVAPEHFRGGPIPERSLYWCLLTFLEEKKKLCP